jgi:hypothetical protein
MDILACSLEVALVDYVKQSSNEKTVEDAKTTLRDGKYALTYNETTTLLTVEETQGIASALGSPQPPPHKWLVPVQQIRWMTPK